MAKYFYRVKTKDNKISSNYIIATSLTHAANKLESQGYTIIEISEEIGSIETNSFNNSNNRITRETIFSVKEKIEFFNSFYYMYKSGLSILQIFQSVLTSTHNTKIKGLCTRIINKIEKGSSLDEAFTGYENALGLAYTKLIIAGERSGKLEDVLLNAIKHIKREEEIKKNVISSIAYPTFIFALSIAVFLLFKLCILKLFTQMGTGITMGCVIKYVINTIIAIIVTYSVIGFSIFYAYKNKKILKKISNFFSNIHPINILMKNYYFANFFSVLALAYEAGIASVQAIELANSVIGSNAIKAKISAATKKIINGCEITTAFNLAQVFSPFAMSQISAGEKSGELDKMFKIVSHEYEKQLDLAIKVLVKILEPMIMIFAAGMVLYVAATAYSTYYSSFFNSL